MDEATYRNGMAILPGDRVRIEHGRTDGIVEALILSPEEIRLLNVEVAGVMLLSDPFGRVFWPIACDDDPLVFVARGEVPGSESVV